MTRINTIPVEELSDQHLFAEWRELPRVISASKKSNVSGYISSTKYILNTGHVKFFYNKKKWLKKRYAELTIELLSRNFKISQISVDFSPLDRYHQIEWEPDQNALAISRERISEKIKMKPNWYRWSKKA